MLLAQLFGLRFQIAESHVLCDDLLRILKSVQVVFHRKLRGALLEVLPRLRLEAKDTSATWMERGGQTLCEVIDGNVGRSTNESSTALLLDPVHQDANDLRGLARARRTLDQRERSS